ncbi:MAG: hypothetical protein II611_07890, partial [Treponema sp.]|nr:hypothetical protein [Treponema sp.]
MNSVFCADIGTSSLKAALVDFSGRVLAFSRVQFGLFYTDHAAGEWLGALRKALAGCISFVGGGADIRATAGTGCSSGTGTSAANTAGTDVSFANTGASDTAGTFGTAASSANTGISGNTADICATAGTANICAAAGRSVPSATTKSLYIPRILGFAKKFPSYW